MFKSGTSRHFDVACYVSAALADDIKSDTAGIYVQVSVLGVVISTATQNAQADKVWDEAISGHLTAGTAGKKLNDVTAAANPWDTDPATYTVAGTFGYALARAIGGAGANLTTITCQDADDNPVEGVRGTSTVRPRPRRQPTTPTATRMSMGRWRFICRSAFGSASGSSGVTPGWIL